MNRFLTSCVRATIAGSLFALMSCGSSKSSDNGDGTGGSSGSGGDNGSADASVDQSRGTGGTGAGTGTGGSAPSEGGLRDTSAVDAPVETGPTTTPCAGDGDCADPTGYCDTTAGVCVQCKGDANCASNQNAPVCNTTTHKCVECTDSGQCGGNLKYCDTAKSRCVQCLDTPNCNSTTRACDKSVDQCVPTCMGDNDCNGLNTNAHTCDTTKGYCVQCLADKDCDNAFVCKDGHCGCPGTATYCGGNSCVDTQNSATRCGDCQTSCRDSQYCSGGACACRPGLTKCGNSCVNMQADPTHCGGCDTKCAATQVCEAGACADSEGGLNPCGEGLHACLVPQAGNTVACVDTKTDPLSCGACGVQCHVDQVCLNGLCENYHPATGCTTCPCEDACGTGINAEGCCAGLGGSSTPICVGQLAQSASDAGPNCP